MYEPVVEVMDALTRGDVWEIRDQCKDPKAQTGLAGSRAWKKSSMDKAADKG